MLTRKLLQGRVKPIKLQGVPSEGFIMPIDSLYKWLDFIGESHEVVTNLKEEQNLIVWINIYFVRSM